jgi:3-dehydroquinate synthase
MLRKFKVASAFGVYEVLLVSADSQETPISYGDATIVDSKVKNLWADRFAFDSINFEANEANKTLSGVEKLITSFRERELTRDAKISVFGGGIIQDVSTLAASIYMRGIKWDYFPTTLLGMVDSCIGGKSSINVGSFKNLAGNFYPPEKIVVDTSFCETLEAEQIVEGLCEAAKICYAESSETFEEYLLLARDFPNISEINLLDIVELSLKTKKKFIEEDEFDQGIRLLLNFGHTFGHAIEAASNFAIKHGVAVGLGILVAKNFSMQLGLASESQRGIGKLCSHIELLIRSIPNIKDHLNKIENQDLMNRFAADKKHSSEKFQAILFNRDGSLVRHFFDKNKDNLKMITSAYSATIERL